MRILLLNQNYAGHGTYWRALQLGRQLAARGHEVLLVTKGQTRVAAARSRADGVEVLATPKGFLGRLHLGEWGALDLAHRLARVVIKPPDVVYGFGLAPDVALPFLASRARARVLDRDDLYTGALLETSLRHTHLARTIPLLERWERGLPQRADAVTVVSDWLYDDTVGLGVDEPRVHYLPHGADLEGPPPPSRDEARARYGLPPGIPLALHGTTGAGDDARFAADALARVLEELPDARFVFVGPPDPDRDERCRALGVAHAVIERPRVPLAEVPTLFAAADVVLIPYGDSALHRARPPMRLGSALAAGRPVAAAAVGDVARIVAEERIGVLARPDLSDFGERVLELLRDPDRAREYGENARRAAEERYDWRLLGARLDGVLRGLV